MDKEVNKGKQVIFCLLVLTLVVPAVTAFGVTAPHWKENPLVLQPGESRDLAFELQNMVGDDDLSVKVSVVKDKTYINLIDDIDTYNVPAKTRKLKVNTKIAIPKDTPLGSTLPVEVYFVTVGTTSEGPLALGVGITKVFDIQVGKQSTPEQHVLPAVQPQQKRSTATGVRPLNKDEMMIAAIIVVIALLLIWLYLQHRKINTLKRRSKKKKVQKKHRSSKRKKYDRW